MNSNSFVNLKSIFMIHLALGMTWIRQVVYCALCASKMPVTFVKISEHISAKSNSTGVASPYFGAKDLAFAYV